MILDANQHDPNTLLGEDVHRVVRHMPKVLQDTMKQHRMTLGGGAIRSVLTTEPISDWDFFGPTVPAMRSFMRQVASVYGNGARSLDTQNAITVLSPPRVPVQAITRWLYDDPKALSDSFDFSIARAVIWWNGTGWASHCDPLFYPDLASRRLRYMSPVRHEDAGGSIMRTLKFLRRGYTIAPESLAKVVARLVQGVAGYEAMLRETEQAAHAAEAAEAEAAGNPFDEDERPLATVTGMPLDMVLAGLLRQVDPLNIVDGFELAPDDGRFV